MDLRRRGLLCLVTDRRRMQAAGDAEAIERLVGLVHAAGTAGIDLIHVRERDLAGAVLTQLVHRCTEAVAGTGTKVVVNDRVDIAIAAGANGAHLRSESYAASRARELLGPAAIIGRSLHTLGETSQLSRDAALNYLVFGTMFPSVSKQPGHRYSTLNDLHMVTSATDLPVLAIGGVSLANVREIAAHGASGVAAIGLFLPPSGVPAQNYLVETARRLREPFDSPTSVS